MKGLKEAELREFSTCGVCRRKIGETKLPLFYLVTIERHGINPTAVQRQQGLGMMLGGSGALAMAMGPDEDMTVPLTEKPWKVMVCEECSLKPVMLVQLCEAAVEVGE